ISVDLPAPFWPSSACVSPARISRLTPFSATTPGKRLTMPSAWRNGASRPMSIRLAFYVRPDCVRSTTPWRYLTKAPSRTNRIPDPGSRIPAWILLRLFGVARSAPAPAPAGPTTAAARATAAAPAVLRRLGVFQSVDLVRVDLLIADAVAVLVEVPHRLLKETGLRIPLRHRAFGDIQPVLAHADEDERARLIEIVRQLELDALDEILVCPEHPRHLHVALQELRRGVDDRAADVVLPVARAAQVAADARLRPRRAVLPPLDTLRLDRAVVHDRHRVELPSALPRIHGRRD